MDTVVKIKITGSDLTLVVFVDRYICLIEVDELKSKIEWIEASQIEKEMATVSLYLVEMLRKNPDAESFLKAIEEVPVVDSAEIVYDYH